MFFCTDIYSPQLTHSIIKRYSYRIIYHYINYMNTAFQNAMKQLETAADVMDLEPNIYEMLQHPKRVLTVSIPVHMDDDP